MRTAHTRHRRYPLVKNEAWRLQGTGGPLGQWYCKCDTAPPSPPLVGACKTGSPGAFFFQKKTQINFHVQLSLLLWFILQFEEGLMLTSRGFGRYSNIFRQSTVGVHCLSETRMIKTDVELS